MDNTDVEQLLDDCQTDIASVEMLIIGIGVTSNVVPYLTKYSLIKACGTIEQAFKSLIADHCERRTKTQVKRFITRKIRENSANPSYENICSLLNDFDENWKQGFKATINAKANKTALKTSLQSLVDSRNEFAHGGSPNLSIGDIKQYYRDAREVIEALDAVVQ